MTGVTRLARTSVLILLLLGGLSPVPAFAAGPPWYFYNQCTGGGRYDYEIKVSGTIVPTNGIWWVATVDTVDGDKIYGTTPAGAPGPCGYPKFQGTKDTHPDDLQGLMQGVPDGSYAIADNNSLSTDAFDPSSGYGNPAYHFFHIKNGLVYMDTEPNSTTTTATTTTTTPPSVHNDVVWASTSAQPNELRVYTPSFPNPWFGGTALNPSVKLGTWDKPDFTATASTTVHIWSRWNGVSSNILDVVLRTSKGGDPFFGSAYATTTAEFITPNNDSYYRLGVTATSALEEYVIPARIGETLHQGDEVWALLAPSYASYGADHWVGSNGSMPYMEICEGPCDTPTTIPPPPSGPSSVLFLPGIESSRLYKPRAFCVVTSLTDCVDQLWEPNIDGDVQNLFMNPDGTSIRSDIYTKDVVDSYLGSGNTDIYKSFSTFMDSEVAAHKVATWKAAPYDWRYAIDTVVNGGTLSNGKVSYAGIATSSYLVNQVLALASSSPAGKVTIIAHSNGGLVAKLLVNKLKDMGKGDLVDKIVFVGVPQLGTPKAIPSILHGYEQANAHGLVTRLSTARELAKNSPGAYTLLPSESYTNKVATPTVLFDQDSITTAGFRSYYGISLDSQSELENFLTGALDQRPQPVSFSDTDTPIKISSTLLTHAKGIETTLASWTPPTNTKVYEVAGVGLDTPSGITYKDSCVHCLIFTHPHLSFEANTVLDGDGTVVAGSALDGNGNKYYFNIEQFNQRNPLNPNAISYNHATIMGASSVVGFIESALMATTSNIGNLPSFITTSSPDFSQKKHLVYRIHSPVSLDLYDNQGNHTGIATTTLPDGTTLSYINNGIPGATYDEFGEVKYVFSDAETPLHIVMNGQASGYVTYDILEMTGNIVTATTTFVNIPVATTTRISMDIQGSISTASNLHVDQNGDGINEYNLVPRLNGIVEIPKSVLQIVPDNREIQLGSSIGSLAARLTGFQIGDIASSTVVGSASCTTTATATSGVGTYPITCTKGTLVSDKYSFSSNAIGTLRITYRFDGFLQPINDTAHQISLAKSVFKAGSTAPVKLQLKKADGSIVQSATSPVWLAPQKGSPMSSPVDENVYPDSGTTGTNFKWDTTSQQYIYNWNTKGFASGYWYKITVQVDDGSIFTVVIGLK